MILYLSISCPLVSIPDPVWMDSDILQASTGDYRLALAATRQLFD